MPGNHDSFDDADRADRGFRDDEPERMEDDREHCVANRPNPLPGREEDEEELAEADILEELDLDDLDDSDMFDRE
jgi:hypothetical protein